MHGARPNYAKEYSKYKWRHFFMNGPPAQIRPPTRGQGLMMKNNVFFNKGGV
jgi:hypothetical protein